MEAPEEERADEPEAEAEVEEKPKEAFADFNLDGAGLEGALMPGFGDEDSDDDRVTRPRDDPAAPDAERLFKA